MSINRVVFGAAMALAAACLTVPAQANYRQKAEEQTEYIQKNFYDTVAKRYHGSYPEKPGGLPWELMWGNGVQWRTLVSATQYDSKTYRPLLDQFGDGLRLYWDPVGPNPGFNAYCSGPGGNDKYYDDNAWMVLGFIEAYHQTHDKKFLQWARETQDFVLSGWDEKLGGGIYWSLKRQEKNTCVNGPAAVSALRLSTLGDGQVQKDWALRIIKWTNNTLQDKDGLYWDNIKLDGKITQWKFTYNTGLMIQADVLLSQLNRDPQYLREAERVANAAIAAWQAPATGAFENNSEFTHLLCEGLLQLYEADHDLRYLNAVRRHATFGYRYIRDTENGGYWTRWKIGDHKPDDRKSLLENSSDARLFWLLVPYLDSDELYTQGLKAASHGQDAKAEDLLRQASDSDTEFVEARYHLWNVLKREKKFEAAHALEQELTRFAQDPAMRARLEAIGWKAPSYLGKRPKNPRNEVGKVSFAVLVMKPTNVV